MWCLTSKVSMAEAIPISDFANNSQWIPSIEAFPREALRTVREWIGAPTVELGLGSECLLELKPWELMLMIP